MGDTEDIPNLDFMRACAVLFVCGFHLLLFFQVSPGGLLDFHSLGQWGVLVFFVHTSLVLTLSLERQGQRAPNRRLFWPFMIRRGFRILPLSILLVCVVESCALPVGHLRNGNFLPVQLNLPGLLANLLLVQNITHADSATAPLWSLPYEMQMYLLLPALFMLARSTSTVLPVFGLWVVGLFAALHTKGMVALGLPDLVGYTPYFLPGIIAYKRMGTPKVRLPAFLWPVVIAAITGFYLRSPSGPRGAICCLMIGVSIPHFAQISQPFIVNVSQQIARYSYGIYLTHFICIWLAFRALKALPRSEEWAVFILSAVLFPYVLYHVIEAPMIRLGRRIAASVEDLSTR